MDLALDIDISPRHLSFVETGRSIPGADLLMQIAAQLDVPLRTRNTWLLAAGYAPRYSEQGLDSARMAQARAAVQRLLDTHDPYPGVALDRHWNVVLHNQAAAALMALLPASLSAQPMNMFRASLHPQGFAAYTQNFDEWGSYLLQVLQRLMLNARDESIVALVEEINTYPNVQALKQSAPGSAMAAATEPALLVPCVLDLHGQQLSLFTTLTTFGSPRDITLHELCVELFYPSDMQTEAFLKGRV
ncbi:helix-turn-helix transcriptional regulator [Undibacterium sp. CY18W]|uniref:Helix-turn-helix transcriptional regulator n=2 Tax=Undibacterium hunanense TaxID=2762292 RepID=A0ABR6ZTH1_9BURK|nr:helix-turn-helix transcriptional regulator [Undibacterium hunanense]